MPLLNSKDHWLGTLNPFGLFNRVLAAPDGLYLESGMLAYSMGYFVPDSYKPAQWKYLRQYSPIVGNVGMESVLTESQTILHSGIPSSDAVFLKMYTVKKVLYSTAPNTNTVESKAVGCAVKTDTVEMINPNGDQAVCSYTYIPVHNQNPLIPNPGSLGSLMDYVNAQAIIATSATTGITENGVQEHCIKPDHTKENLTDKGNKIYCNQDIMLKKFCIQTFPASAFSGKLRLYIQCIYGGTQIKYKSSGGISPSLYLGMNLDVDNNTTSAPRVAVLDKGTHFLYTTNYHHFLIRNEGLAVNPLVPVGIGHRFKRYLQQNPDSLSQDVLDNLEAYLLSVSFPTLTGNPSSGRAATQKAYSKGRPFYFGLNGNWDGSSAAMVTQTRQDDNYRITSLVQVSVSTSGIEDVLQDELNRKIESLLLDYRVSLGLDAYPFGVYRHWVSEAKVTTRKNSDDQTEIVIVGDIEDGGWWFAINVPKGPPKVDPSDAMINEEKQSNRVYGGLPYSKECLDALMECFHFDAQVDSSVPWMEPFQQDKIWYWDSFVQDYYYDLPCIPFNNYEKCRSAVVGSFPIYCWYNRNGELITAYYNYQTLSEGDNDVQPPNGLCGAGHDEESSKTYGSGASLSGFVVNSAIAMGVSAPFLSNHFMSADFSSGSWQGGPPNAIWAGTCGMGFCDGNECPDDPGGISFFYTHWVTTKTGNGVLHTKDSTGSGSHRSFILIPKNDCQALHVGAYITEDLTEHEVVTNYKDCGTEAKCSKIFWSGTSKVVGEQSTGWLTCIGLYFAKSFGPLIGGSPLQFATQNWCVYYPGGREVGHFSCNFRNWGPDGPERVTGGLITPYFGNKTKQEIDDHILNKASVKGYLVLPSGTKNIMTAEGSGQGTSKDDPDQADVDANSTLKNPYTYLFTDPDPKWPYAGCGDRYDIMTTINKDDQLVQSFGTDPDLIPKPWPFGDFNHPVGYV